MCIRAKNSVDKFRPETRPHSQSSNQRHYRERDADQADPRHNAHTALSTARAQIAPRDHPLKAGKRGRR